MVTKVLDLVKLYRELQESCKEHLEAVAVERTRVEQAAAEAIAAEKARVEAAARAAEEARRAQEAEEAEKLIVAEAAV